MIDPISLTVAGCGTWGVAYAWAKSKEMSHSDAVKHANKVTGKTFKVVSGFFVIASGDIGGVIDKILNS